MAQEGIDTERVKIERLLSDSGFTGCRVDVLDSTLLTVTLSDGIMATGQPDQFDLAIVRAKDLSLPLATAFEDAGLLY